MSIDEARQQKALALLEHEEAKDSYDALRDEAEALASRMSSLSSFAASMRRRSDGNIRDARLLRSKIDAEAPELRAAMDFDALLDLDNRLLAAEARLQNAIEVKKTFGMTR